MLVVRTREYTRCVDVLAAASAVAFPVAAVVSELRALAVAAAASAVAAVLELRALLVLVSFLRRANPYDWKR